MIVPANPGWAREHVRRLQAAKIQPHFQITSKPNCSTLERMIRAGAHRVP